MVIGYYCFAEKRLDDGSAQQFRDFEDFVARAERTLAHKHRNPLAAIEDIERARNAFLVRHALAVGLCKRHVVSHIASGWLGLFDALLLNIHGDRDMRDGALGDCHATRERHGVVDMRRAHDARRVDGDVGEQFSEIDILLRKGVDEIVIG